MAMACNTQPAQGSSDPVVPATSGPAEKPAKSPEKVAPDPVVFIDQGWSPQMRDKFYYTPQGSHLLPYDWYLALEHPDAPTLLSDETYLSSLKFLANPTDVGGLNPGKLPIGLTYETDKAGKHWLGMTCAACHTAQIEYQGTHIRIDGGPTLANISVFTEDVRNSLLRTAKDSKKFERFATRLLGDEVDAATRKSLRDELQAQIKKLPSSHPDAGFGREDAFGVIFNEVAGTQLGLPENLRSADAPVSFPHLWGTPKLAWVQYIGLAANPIGRNIGEVLGVFGHIDYPDTVTKDGFTSSVLVKNLYELESWVDQLSAPKWPAQFPPIDAAKAARGKEIYSEKNRCSGCHALQPYPMSDAKANKFGKQFVNIKMIPLAKIGTDPLAATRATERMAKTGKLAPYFKGAEEVPVAQILFLAVDRIFTHEAATLGLTEEQQVAYAGFRFPSQDPPNLVAYKARPLEGIWATAPFLHNGSVPNLYELLLPSTRRSKQFAVGSREFDPKRVGYVVAQSPGAYTFDTSLPGNSNAGHDYASDLSEEDRWALVEFLKTL